MINGAGGRESDRHDSPAKPKVVVNQAVLVDSTQAVTDMIHNRDDPGPPSRSGSGIRRGMHRTYGTPPQREETTKAMGVCERANAGTYLRFVAAAG
jgi:hypothetical protein